MKFVEDHVEQAALEWLEELGWEVAHGPTVSPDGPQPIRGAYQDVVLLERLHDAVARLNPSIPNDTREDAIRCLLASETPSLIEENRRLHRYLVEGVPVEYYHDGAVRGDRVRLIALQDCDDFDQNDWLAVNQFTVIEQGHNRRPDVVLFVNGLPLGVFVQRHAGSTGDCLTVSGEQQAESGNGCPG